MSCHAVSSVTGCLVVVHSTPAVWFTCFSIDSHLRWKVPSVPRSAYTGPTRGEAFSTGAALRCRRSWPRLRLWPDTLWTKLISAACNSNHVVVVFFPLPWAHEHRGEGEHSLSEHSQLCLSAGASPPYDRLTAQLLQSGGWDPSIDPLFPQSQMNPGWFHKDTFMFQLSLKRQRCRSNQQNGIRPSHPCYKRNTPVFDCNRGQKDRHACQDICPAVYSMYDRGGGTNNCLHKNSKAYLKLRWYKSSNKVDPLAWCNYASSLEEAIRC